MLAARRHRAAVLVAVAVPLVAGLLKVRAARLQIGVGETHDFEYDAPPGRPTLWLEVRTSGGRWQSQARVTVT